MDLAGEKAGKLAGEIGGAQISKSRKHGKWKTKEAGGNGRYGEEGRAKASKRVKDQSGPPKLDQSGPPLAGPHLFWEVDVATDPAVLTDDAQQQVDPGV